MRFPVQSYFIYECECERSAGPGKIFTHVLVVGDSKDGYRDDHHAEDRLSSCPGVEAEVLVHRFTLGNGNIV